MIYELYTSCKKIKALYFRTLNKIGFPKCCIKKQKTKQKKNTRKFEFEKFKISSLWDSKEVYTYIKLYKFCLGIYIKIELILVQHES